MMMTRGENAQDLLDDPRTPESARRVTAQEWYRHMSSCGSPTFARLAATLAVGAICDELDPEGAAELRREIREYKPRQRKAAA